MHFMARSATWIVYEPVFISDGRHTIHESMYGTAHRAFEALSNGLRSLVPTCLATLTAIPSSTLICGYVASIADRRCRSLLVSMPPRT